MKIFQASFAHLKNIPAQPSALSRKQIKKYRLHMIFISESVKLSDAASFAGGILFLSEIF